MASTSKKKPFKVWKGHTGYGIVVRNFEELKTKGCRKLHVNVDELEYISLEDGTIVDEDYFQTLPGNTVLIFKEKPSSMLQRLVDHIKPQLKGVSFQDLQAFRDRTDGHSNVIKFIESCLKDNENNEAEEREHDRTWFKGVPSNYKTKSHFMRDKAKARIRKYFNVTKTALLSKGSSNEIDSAQGSASSKERAEDVIKAFERKLKQNRYHDKIFDRTDATGQRICNERGLFHCQGLFDQSVVGKQSKNCNHRHEINPYLRWEFVIEFSCWNLDHQIEKSKEVIPELKNAIESAKKVNVDYFYDLLFTMKNLKLVHTVCHDKGDHGLKVDPDRVHLSS